MICLFLLQRHEGTKCVGVQILRVFEPSQQIQTDFDLSHTPNLFRYKSLIVCLFFSQICVFNGQRLDSLPINLHVQNQALPVIFSRIETDYGIRFYYSPQALPQKPADANFTDTPLRDVLQQLLQKTELGFLFYRDYAVAVAPKQMLESVYSPEYYRVLKESQTQAGDTVNRARLVVGDRSNINSGGRARVKGNVKDAQTGEPIVNAAVAWTTVAGQNALSDQEGHFESTLPVGEHRIRIQYVGYENFEETVTAFNDGDLVIRLMPVATGLSEVLIRADAPDVNVSSARIGVAKLDMKTVKRLPTLLGEADVVRSLLLNTGVTTVGEGAAGFNVRGGEMDQNFMLQDELILFNSTHALGFFSTYNADLISNVELHRSIMPAQFGGRLASVLEVEMRDGSMEKWKLKGGIGPLTGRFSIEGPVVKGKSSVIAGVRASYTDWALKLSKRLEVKRSSAAFHDANFRYTHRLNAKNSLTLSGYNAEDEFVYNRAFGFDYRTLGGQLTYKHTFHSDFFSRLSLAASEYKSTQTDFEGTDGGQLNSGISYYKLKEQLTYHFSRAVRADGGAESVYYVVQPGSQRPQGVLSVVAQKALETEHGLESAVFGNMEWAISPRVTLIGGLRANHYRYLGPKTVFAYDPIVAPENLSDTLKYGGGSTIAKYTNIEPRLSGRYRLDAHSSLKAGYSRTSQFVNQIFNTDTPTPTSQYQLSTNYIAPFRSHNFAAGYFQNTKDNSWEISTEMFYRVIDKLWDYRDFANLTVNEKIETEIRNGRGRAYGFEASVKTSRKLVNGQLGYTFSRTLRKVAGINKGRWYPGSADKPHNLVLVVNYQPSQRHNLTFTFSYSTGRPTTAPLTSYRLQNNLIVPVYSPRNQLRIPDYHRLDVAYTIGRGYNKRKTLKTSWNLSVYNVYARKNAFSVFFTQDPYQKTVANRLATLGTIFPAITLNIETL